MDKTPDFTRYPNYVQDYVIGLERALKTARERIAELSEGPEDSNVRVSGIVVQPDVLLGSDKQIDFYMGTGRRHIDDVVSVRHERASGERNTLRVEGSHILHIQPSAANSFRIISMEH
jgi:hypothetical protein